MSSISRWNPRSLIEPLENSQCTNYPLVNKHTNADADFSGSKKIGNASSHGQFLNFHSIFFFIREYILSFIFHVTTLLFSHTGCTAQFPPAPKVRVPLGVGDSIRWCLRFLNETEVETKKSHAEIPTKNQVIFHHPISRTFEGTITYPTKREKENHRLKTAGW